jgi:hypothetical protein
MFFAVFSSASLICEGVACGCACNNNAHAPLAWGVAMLVPDAVV